MDGVALEGLDKIFVDRCVGIKGGVSELLEDVVETRSPLSGSKTGSGGAVVNHEGDALVVHVGAERVHSLNHRLVHNFRVGVAVLEEDVNLRHHSGDVHTRSGGVEGDLGFHSLGSDLLSYLPCDGVIDLAHWELSVSHTSHYDRSDLVS